MSAIRDIVGEYVEGKVEMDDVLHTIAMARKNLKRAKAEKEAGDWYWGDEFTVDVGNPATEAFSATLTYADQLSDEDADRIIDAGWGG